MGNKAASGYGKTIKTTENYNLSDVQIIEETILKDVTKSNKASKKNDEAKLEKATPIESENTSRSLLGFSERYYYSDDESSDDNRGAYGIPPKNSVPIFSNISLWCLGIEKRINSILKYLFKNPPYITCKGINLNILLIAMLLISALNGILNTRTTKVLGNYSFVIFQTILPGFFVLFSWPIVWITRYFGGFKPVDDIRINWRVYLLLAAIDSISVLLSVFPVLYLSGHLYLMLGQFILPINMILSYLITKTRYAQPHLIGALLIMYGCIIALIVPNSETNIDKSTVRFAIKFEDADPQIVIWSLVMIVSLIPKSLSNIYKEKYTNRHGFSALHFNTWIATFQLPIGWLMLAFIMIPFPPPIFYVDANRFSEYFHDSFALLFGDYYKSPFPLYDDNQIGGGNSTLLSNNSTLINGIGNTINTQAYNLYYMGTQNDYYNSQGKELINGTLLPSLNPYPSSSSPSTLGILDVEYITGLFMLYVIVNIFYNNAFLQVIKKFNSNIAVVWSILAIFLMEIGYNWYWLAGSAYNPITTYDIFVLVIVTVGSITFKMTKNVPKSTKKMIPSVG